MRDGGRPARLRTSCAITASKKTAQEWPNKVPSVRQPTRLVGGWFAVGPALCHVLGACEEADAVLAILVQIAESRVLPAAVAVVADGSRQGKINAYHAYLDLGDEALRRISAARKDGHRVALVMEVRVAQRLLEGLRTNNLQRRAEDLVLIALH